MNKNKKNTIIDRAITVGQILVAILLIFLAAGSFAISFFSISDLALERGVVKSYYLAMIFPFIIDGTIVVSMLSYLIDSFRGHWSEKPKWDGWFSLSSILIIKHYIRKNLAVVMMMSCTSLSVWLNIEHSGSYADVVVALSGFAPIALFFNSELLSDQATTTAKFSSSVTTIEDLLEEQSKLEEANSALLSEGERLKQEVAKETLTLANLQSQQSQYTISLSMCRELEEKVKGLREEAERLASENKAVKSESKQITELMEIHKEQIFCAISTNVLGATQAETGTIIGKSTKTVQSYNKEGVELLNGTMAKFKLVVETIQARKK